MAHRHGAVQPVQDIRMEHLPHQPHILVEGHLPVIDGCDPAGLLPPVLKGVQAVIDRAGTVPLGIPDPEHTAFLMYGHIDSSPGVSCKNDKDAAASSRSVLAADGPIIAVRSAFVKGTISSVSHHSSS